MRTTKKIISLLLVLSTLLLLISYFLPMLEKVKSNNLLADENTFEISIYEMTRFDFNIYFIILPVLAMIFILINNKHTKTIAFGLYISSFLGNLMYFFNINVIAKEMSGSYTYASGLIILLVSSSLILFFTIILIIINLISKSANNISIEINSETLKKSLENLNMLKEQNFITSAEYEEKRATLVKQLKI